MNTQLVEVLRQLKLKPGESITVDVDGQPLEIHFPDPVEPAAYVGQVMMMPWFDSPRQPAGTLLVQLGRLSPPDPPIIPSDEEAAK